MTRVVRWASLGFVLGVVTVAAWTYISFHQPYKGYDAVEQFVDIPPGSGSTAMGRRLADAGVIRNASSFKVAVWIRGAGRRLQAGEYRFTEPMTLAEVVDKIAKGDVFVRSITFREGLTVREMADLYQAGDFGTAAAFIAASKKAALIQHLDPQARDLEGYLFPDTYTMPRRTTADELVERMTKRFEKALAPDIVQQASARGMNTRQLVTLASLVEKETGKAEERPTVAGVYSNRLKIGMGLQCDPTVIYALMLAGRYDGNIRRDDLQIDSPYNTYRYSGLPPGPIAAPGEASLRAAANPAGIPYLYFVARGDGSHVFSTTLDQHNRNVNEFQRRKKP